MYTPLLVPFTGTGSANTLKQLRLAQFLTLFFQLTRPSDFGTSEPFFVESCQNQHLQGNPNTSKQTLCIYSLKVRRQNKGLKQQTGLGVFFPIACFQCSLKTFIKSLQSVLCFWLEGAGVFSPVTVTVEFLESHDRHNMAHSTPNLPMGPLKQKCSLKP